MSDLRYPTASPAMVKDIMNEVIVLYLHNFNDTVEVIVGKDEEELRLQFASKVLALHSEYFRVKIEIDSLVQHAKSEPLVINLCEQDIGALEAFFVWNTTGDILSSESLSPVTVDPNTAVITAEKLDEYVNFWDRLLECYFLADFLGAPAFGNATMDALLEAIDNETKDREKLESKFEVSAPHLEVDNSEDDHDHSDNDEDESDDEEDHRGDVERRWEAGEHRDPFDKNLPRQEIRQMLGTLPHQIRRVYSMTKADSLLQKMLVDKIMKQSTDHHPYYEKLNGLLKEGMPVEFHQDLMNEMMRSFTIVHQISQGTDSKRLSADCRALRRCYYHIHRVGERCPKPESDSGS
ncbi:uncharacterized protein EAE98_009969 [Botrytis deweyae]|uniref:BTB domain-containing protein n=1 Tax=Botrytis deweyae TaxID=2478750 RepID=A0ABQ7IA04_9HELO|nr:uncharacterized protein EAE98_009969 [Botrytis deweyae]KAF7917941.1 hypothetical protein EAE98_009969 [Botrytis deweyae]